MFVSVNCYLVLEYFIHSIMHRRNLCYFLYKCHHSHHITYNIHEFTQNKPYQHDNSYIIIIPIVMLIWMIVHFLFNFETTIIFIVSSGSLLFITDYLHTQYHITNSWLETNCFTKQCFLKRRKLHLLHHKTVTKNLSLGGISIYDHLFNTYTSN